MLKLPKNEKQEKQMLTVEIDKELLTSVKSTVKKRKITLRQAVEFGLHAFAIAALSETNVPDYKTKTK